jgi:antitoxin (DNA-binding transcriptional repressor) of toxin-antitoxin stability system
MANEQNLKPFQKGGDERINLQGRPQKLITQMKEIGYTKSQVEETMLSMLSLSRKELEKIDKGEEYTIMERTIAGALLKGHDKNSLFNLEMLLTRSQGKPKETIDQTIQSKNFTITLNLDESKLER